MTMWGTGLLKGMRVTWRHLWGKKETFYYPEEKLPMTERFRGGHLRLDSQRCICCQLCIRSCPNGAIKLTAEVGEDKKRHVVTYEHDLGRCMYCDLCLEACPTHLLSWDKNYEISTYFKDDLCYDLVAEDKASAPKEVPA